MSRANVTLEYEGTDRDHPQAVYKDKIIKDFFIAADKEPTGSVSAEQQQALADAEDRVRIET